MTTTPTSTPVATVEPVFTEPERLALAGFLAGYTGLTARRVGHVVRRGGEDCAEDEPDLLDGGWADSLGLRVGHPVMNLA